MVNLIPVDSVWYSTYMSIGTGNKIGQIIKIEIRNLRDARNDTHTSVWIWSSRSGPDPPYNGPWGTGDTSHGTCDQIDPWGALP
ncbi:hypothetical protein L1987_34766 [Smallanthus sonchifolius]|uniref:Uncharacterized protein n=1 Tax=Smallanthus sonchifolius TaxID=185202 RepID=A0ACB9HVK1_9ASTR|nr:hypothetical protein L1987_34766 [Smallanthus sonchifolius]